MSARYALFGSPIERSPSAVMHAAGFRSLGIDASYELRPADAGAGRELVAAVTRGDWAGANITTPLKTEVAGLVPLVGSAALAGAVNTLWRDGERLVGSLTDVEGVAQPLARRNLEIGVALVLGAGGAARAACLALDRAGAEIWVAARDPSRAEALLAELRPSRPGFGLGLDQHHVLGDVVASASAVVQATPIGRAGDRHPLPWHLAPSYCVAFEMVYSPRRTPFLEEANRHGLRTIEGWEMLLAQGAGSFRLWTGREAPEAAMREALLARLDAAAP